MLLQTYIEYLRGELEDKKEMNHHGKNLTWLENNNKEFNLLKLHKNVWNSQFLFLIMIAGKTIVHEKDDETPAE